MWVIEQLYGQMEMKLLQIDPINDMRKTTRYKNAERVYHPE